MISIGLDTGFFLKLLEGNEKSIGVWEEVVNGKVKAKTSSLVVFELKRILLKLGKPELWSDIKEAIILNCEIISVDTNIAEKGASISYGNGLPAVDSLIYTSLIDTDVFYTTDRSFEILKERNRPRIEILK